MQSLWRDPMPGRRPFREPCAVANGKTGPAPVVHLVVEQRCCINGTKMERRGDHVDERKKKQRCVEP